LLHSPGGDVLGAVDDSAVVEHKCRDLAVACEAPDRPAPAEEPVCAVAPVVRMTFGSKPAAVSARYAFAHGWRSVGPNVP
jgi:hypothetical protein